MRVNRFQRPPLRRRRDGVSLFEVVASIALLSIVILPVASMTRSSARLLERSETMTDQQLVRATLRWIRQDVGGSPARSGGALTYLRKSSAGAAPVPATVFPRGDQLIFRSGGSSEILLDRLSGWTIDNRGPNNDPGDVVVIGLEIENPQNGQRTSYRCTIDAITPSGPEGG